MKGVKIAASVVSIVEGIGAIIGGIVLTVFGALWKPIFGELFLEASNEIGYNLTWLNELYTVLFIVLGVYLVVLGILSLIFAIKFNKADPKNGTTVALLVFSILMGSVPAIVLLIVYLTLSDKKQSQSPVEHSI